jgi:hypothetical protein
MTSFEQRIRNAKTILEAHMARWPKNAPSLSERDKDFVAAIMVDYAVQCELIILRERETEKL